MQYSKRSVVEVKPAFAARALGYWTMHVLLAAAPSFALAYLTRWHTIPAVWGMTLGMAMYVVAYTSIWTICGFGRSSVVGRWERALRRGTWVRLAISYFGWISILGFKVLGAICSIDLFAGAIAVEMIESWGRAEPLRFLRIAIAGPDPSQRAENVLVGDTNSLIPTFLITVTEGFFLSLMLLLLSWLIWLFTPSQAAKMETVARNWKEKA